MVFRFSYEYVTVTVIFFSRFLPPLPLFIPLLFFFACFCLDFAWSKPSTSVFRLVRWVPSRTF